MKTKISIFVMAILCLYNTSRAQLDTTNTATTFTQQMDSFFSLLPHWQYLPDSNLYDRVYPFATLDDYAPIGNTYFQAIDSLPATVTITKYTGNIISGNSKGDILSGTFDMVMQNSAGSKIHLTKGRFDIKTQ